MLRPAPRLAANPAPRSRIGLPIILIGLLFSIAALGAVKVARRRAAVALAAASDQPARLAPASERRAPRWQTSRSAPALVPSHAVHAGAHLHGRLLLPPGSQADGFRVEAAAGDEPFRVAVRSDATFSMRVPAGTYHLQAAGDELVGDAEVTCVADDEREVLIQMVPAATIKGAVRAPHPVETAVMAYRAGTDTRVAITGIGDDGTFAVEGLMGNTLYDLRIQDEGQGTALQRNVRAPASGVVLNLTAGAVLLGAVGMEGERECPVHVVRVVAAHRDFESGANVDSHCRFRLDTLPRGVSLEVTALGDGWHLSADVNTPAEGDPAPLCFNPPCRDLPPRESASLDVAIDGLPADSGFMVEAYPADEPGAGRSCSSRGTGCLIGGGLAVGVPLEVRTMAPGCAPLGAKPVLHAGPNTLRLTCHRTTAIQGTLRMADGRPAPIGAEVRCPGASEEDARPIGMSLFELECIGNQTVVEYRLDHDKPWRQAPVMAGNNPWVDIRP